MQGKLYDCQYKARGGCQYDKLRDRWSIQGFEAVSGHNEEKIDTEELQDAGDHRQRPLPVVGQHGYNGEIDQPRIDERHYGTVKSHDEQRSQQRTEDQYHRAGVRQISPGFGSMTYLSDTWRSPNQACLPRELIGRVRRCHLAFNALILSSCDVI